MNSDHRHSKEDEDDLQLQFDSINNVVPAPYEDDHSRDTIPSQRGGRAKTDIQRHNGKIEDDKKNTKRQLDTNSNGENKYNDNHGEIQLNDGIVSTVDTTKQTNNPTTTTINASTTTTTTKGTSPIKRFDTKVEKGPPLDEIAKTQLKLIQENKPSTDLEIALSAELERKNAQIEKLTSEVIKLKQFISKRKQTYKRKRKEDGAPTRALSAYNIFVQERFEQLARQNQEALMSSNTDKTLQRVPPASLVAQAGNEWRELPPEQKEIYKERAKADKKRYEEEMQKYNPPENQTNKRRNKTGYNLFFSEFVEKERLNNSSRKEDDMDHDVTEKERGNLAKIVGNAWKALSLEEREEYEQRAERINASEGFSPGDEVEDEEEERQQQQQDENHEEKEPNVLKKKDQDAKPSSLVVNDGPMRIPQAPVVHQPGHHDVRSPYHPPPPPHPHGHFYPPFPYEYYPPIPMPHPHHLATAAGKEDHHHHHHLTTGGGNPRHMAAHHLHPFPYPPPPPHYMHHPHYRQHEHSSPHNKLPRPSSPADM